MSLYSGSYAHSAMGQATAPSTPYSYVISSSQRNELHIDRATITVPKLVKRLERVLTQYQTMESMVWGIVCKIGQWVESLNDPGLTSVSAKILEELAPAYDTDLKVASLRSLIKSFADVAKLEAEEKELEIKLRVVEEKLARFTVNSYSLSDIETNRILYNRLQDLHKQALQALLSSGHNLPPQMLTRFCETMLERNEIAMEKFARALNLVNGIWPAN